MTDFMQLVPTRMLKASYSEEKDEIAIELQLKGFAPHNTRKIQISGQFMAVRTNPVMITLEKHDDTIPGELGWKPEREPIWVSGLPDAQEEYLMTWSSEVKLAIKVWKQRRKYRLVIKEFEYFSADGQVILNDGEYEVESSQAGRVVYSDIIDLADFL